MQQLKAMWFVGFFLLLCGGLSTLAVKAAPQVDSCATRDDVLGLSRMVEVDTSGGPLFGRGSNEFLADGEIVLTFDDGPLRPYTRAVLKALAQHCTKATFFLVGRMAASDPAMVREVAQAGHTVGSHTWSHAKLSSLSADKAEEEVEMGLSAVAAALEAPAAPFFRFPYLRPNTAAVDYLKTRDIASFMIDVDSRDFRTRDAAEVQKNVLTQLAGRRKGIILFHDIQRSTVHALPELLAELKKRGFKVVHMVPKETAHTLPAYDARVGKLMARKLEAAKADPLAPRAMTWPQTDEQEVLPWSKHTTSATTQPSAGAATKDDTTVPWYKKWLTP
jgi:peptidoglycan-N-acetylglucosamine deacetylase